jgi:hypothetical protein
LSSIFNPGRLAGSHREKQKIMANTSLNQVLVLGTTSREFNKNDVIYIVKEFFYLL